VKKGPDGLFGLKKKRGEDQWIRVLIEGSSDHQEKEETRTLLLPKAGKKGEGIVDEPLFTIFPREAEKRNLPREEMRSTLDFSLLSPLNPKEEGKRKEKGEGHHTIILRSLFSEKGRNNTSGGGENGVRKQTDLSFPYLPTARKRKSGGTTPSGLSAKARKAHQGEKNGSLYSSV